LDDRRGGKRTGSQLGVVWSDFRRLLKNRQQTGYIKDEFKKPIGRSFFLLPHSGKANPQTRRRHRPPPAQS
jgi:hypothetical protein